MWGVGTTWGGDHGDNIETTVMGVWGPLGQCEDDRDDVGMTGTTWGLQGCGDHEITKNSITFE